MLPLLCDLTHAFRIRPERLEFDRPFSAEKLSWYAVLYNELVFLWFFGGLDGVASVWFTTMLMLKIMID